MDMNCEEVRDLVPLYAGGELEEGERVAAEAHLAFCADCARELDLYREIRAELAGLRGDEPPPATWRELREGIEAELFPRRRRRPAFGGLLPFAAALLLGATLGLAAYVARGIPAPSGSPAALAPDGRGIGEFLQGRTPAGPAGALPAADPAAVPLRLRIEPNPKFLAPRVVPDGRHYLPRVEAFPPPDERDF